MSTAVHAPEISPVLSARAVAPLIDRCHSQVKWLAAHYDPVRQKVDGRWQFTRAAVDAYREQRRMAEAYNQVGWRRPPSQPILNKSGCTAVVRVAKCSPTPARSRL